jgi:hypothetical protein
LVGVRLKWGWTNKVGWDGKNPVLVVFGSKSSQSEGYPTKKYSSRSEMILPIKN